MTAKQAITIEQALKRAKAENIHIVGYGTVKADGSKFWAVSSKNYAKTSLAYIVTIGDDHRLHCNCRAQDICKHTAVVHQALKDASLAAPKTCTQCGGEVEYCAGCDAEHANFDEPQPDIVALLAEPDLPASALYFEDDEPKPSMAKRAAAAIRVDHTPEYFSIFKA